MTALTPRDREALSTVVSALPVPVTQVEAALRTARLIGGSLLSEQDRDTVRSKWDAMFTEPAKGPKRTADERIAAALESIATTLAAIAEAVE